LATGGGGHRHAPTALPPGKKPLYQLTRRLSEPITGLDVLEWERCIALRGIELRFLGRCDDWANL